MPGGKGAPLTERGVNSGSIVRGLRGHADHCPLRRETGGTVPPASMRATSSDDGPGALTIAGSSTGYRGHMEHSSRPGPVPIAALLDL